MSADLISRGIEIFKVAVAHDTALEYTNAFPRYMEAIEIFMTVVKYENNPAKSRLLKVKISEMMDRAEKIKLLLDNQRRSEATAQVEGRSMVQRNEEQSEKFGPEIVPEQPIIPWLAVAGLEGAKRSLKECVLLPAKFPQIFKQRHVVREILLYGAPGTGKSHLVRALATECSANLYHLNGVDLISGQARPMLVKRVFAAARETAMETGTPSMIFVKDLETLSAAAVATRDDMVRRVKTELLVQLSEASEGLFVIASTSRPWDLDGSIRRRFQLRIFVPLPDVRARETMLRFQLGDMCQKMSDLDIRGVAARTEGHSCKEVADVARYAMMEPIRRLQCLLATQQHTQEADEHESVTYADLINALERSTSHRSAVARPTSARTNDDTDDVLKFLNFAVDFGSEDGE